MSLRLAGRAGEVGPADLGQARRSLKVELRPAGVAAAGGRAGDIAAADLGQGGAAPAGVTAAGGRAGEVGPADLGQAPRSLRQGRCTEHASRGARLSDHCVCAGSEQEAGRADPRGMLHAVSAHMRAVFASYPHASHALKFWLHARRIDCALDHCVCAGSEQEAGRAAPRGMLHAVSAHMRAVFASYPHASHALKFWLHALHAGSIVHLHMLHSSLVCPHASHAFQHVLTDWSHFLSTLFQVLPIGSVCGYILWGRTRHAGRLVVQIVKSAKSGI